MSRGVTLGLISILLGLLGQLAWKTAILRREGGISIAWLTSLLTDTLTLAGIALYGLSTLVWLVALKMEEISKLYPMLSLNFALILLAGHFLFGEAITPLKILGVALIFAGVLMVAL